MINVVFWFIIVCDVVFFFSEINLFMSVNLDIVVKSFKKNGVGLKGIISTFS